MASSENEISTPPPPPPSLEELSRRGVRSLFLPYIIGLISDSSSPQSTQSPREVLVLVNFRTGSITMVEGTGQIEAFLRGKEGPLPASKASIEAMETVEVKKEDEFECSICLTEYETEGGLVKEMPCKHRFHLGCIGKWLSIHGSCPICRYQMPVEEEKINPKFGDEMNDEELNDNSDNDNDNGNGGGGEGFSGAGFVFHIYVAGSRRREAGSGLDSDSENGNPEGENSGSDMDMDIDSD